MAHLLVCRNASILVRETGQPDRLLDPADPLAILAHLRSRTSFEEGLTSAGLMRALRPWAEVLSRMAWIDFDAWDKAVTKPDLRVVGPGSSPPERTDDPPLAAVEIAPVLEMYRRRRGHLEFYASWRTSGRYSRLRICPHSGAEDIHCSLSFTRPSEWAHLPLVLGERAWTAELDATPRGRASGDDRTILFPPHLASGRLDPSPIEMTPVFFDAVVLGFLDDISHFGDPDESAEIGAEIEGRITEAFGDAPRPGEELLQDPAGA